MFVAIAVTDWLTEFELRLGALYLGVIVFITWFNGWKQGVIFSILSFIDQFAIGVVLGNRYSHFYYFVIDQLNWIAAYCAAVYFVDGTAQSSHMLRAYAVDLEQRVAVRTQALETANRELESFRYAVAHDLRAPVRAINSYAAMLLQASKGQLDSISAEYLQRVANGGHRMAMLIDDLLKLARLSRTEMEVQDIDLSKLAATIIESLTAADPKPDATVTIQPDIRISGDPGLIRAVIENLIGNAWKFTAKTNAARITVGCEQRDAKKVYFVCDNGIGFDMQYAHKLFAPFQRLHSRDEFEGTGIGLATVKKIIDRHGGKVWIESSVDKGAAVFFTVGESS